jgi:spore cortex formation protein SpoVR/YcgB (stage V sporulation)
MKGDMTLTLEYRPYKERSLHRPNAQKTIEFVKLLWGYDVEIVQADENGIEQVLVKAK